MAHRSMPMCRIVTAFRCTCTQSKSIRYTYLKVIAHCSAFVFAFSSWYSLLQMNSNNNCSSPDNSNAQHKPATASTRLDYNTFSSEHTKIAIGHSQPVPLTQLKNQSALIQCPHCLKHVYTKISSADLSDVIITFTLVHLFLPFDVAYLGECSITAAIWLLIWFTYTSHSCPSCNKSIATFNALKRVVGITAPAIAITTSTTASSSSDRGDSDGSPPLYSC